MTEILEDEAHASPDKRPKPEVTITYNGVDREIHFRPELGMHQLLNHAMDAFSIAANRHLMALWTAGGLELPITGSAEEAGVHAGELLVLRPSAVRGG